MKDIILLVGHGSRDRDGNDEFLAFSERVRLAMPDRHIEACFLELAKPDIPTGVDRTVSHGATRVIVVPVILLAASHVKWEIPEFIDAARKKYPLVEFVYGKHVGLHEQILNILVDRFQATETARTKDLSKTAIVLMGRGSSHPDANGDVYKMARLLWERTGVMTVEVCFTGITTPLLPEGVARAVSLQANHIVVVPYFLFTGVLIKRMTNLLQTLKTTYSDASFEMADYFGDHPLLLDVVVDRIREAACKEAYMNCDFCSYRQNPGEAHHPHHHHDDAHAHDEHDHLLAY